VSDPELRRRLTEAILGAPIYTVDELMAITGTRRELADDLWLSLGFPLLVDDDGAKDYAEPDAEALRSLNGLLELDLLQRPTLMSMTRVMGQAMARLASAQVQMFNDELRAIVDEDVEGITEDDRAAITEILVTGVERFVSYCYRRHLLAALNRTLDADHDRPVIGFVDVVDFTRTTRQLGDDELADVVGRFERHVYATITNSGARLRKQLGDGVMFDAPDAATAASAALALVMRCAEDPQLAGARGGLAVGPTLEMDGDVYGETVNRASRLAALAYPNTVVADQAVADVVQGLVGFTVRPLGARSVKGLGKVEVAVIRPALI
jgi:adenylate cyclase